MELVSSFYLGVSDYLNCDEGGEKECNHYSTSDKGYQNFDRYFRSINTYTSKSSIDSQQKNIYLEHFELESNNVEKIRAELELDDQKITSKHFCIEYITQEDDPCLPVLVYLDSVFLISNDLIDEIEEQLEEDALVSKLIIDGDVIDSGNIEIAELVEEVPYEELTSDEYDEIDSFDQNDQDIDAER